MATNAIEVEPSEVKPAIQSSKMPPSIASSSENKLVSNHSSDLDATQIGEVVLCCNEQEDIASDRQIKEYLQQLYPTPLEQNRLCLDRMHQMTRKRVRSVSAILPFSNLRFLDVSNNAIYTTSGLEALNMLETLIIARNQLRGFDDSIFELTGLHHLNVSGNFIHHIPRRIASLTRLETFDISGNNLGIVKEISVLSELGNLSICSFAGNPFCALPYYRDYVIHKIKSLEYLDEGAVSLLMRKQSHRRFNDLSFAKDQQLNSMRNAFETKQSKMLKEQENLSAENSKLRSELHLKAKLLQNKSKEWSIATNQLLQLQQELAMLNLEDPSVKLSSLEAIMAPKCQAFNALSDLPPETTITAIVPAKTRKRVENQALSSDRNGIKVLKPFSFAGSSVPPYSFQFGASNSLRLATIETSPSGESVIPKSQNQTDLRPTRLEMETIPFEKSINMDSCVTSPVTLEFDETSCKKLVVDSMETANPNTSLQRRSVNSNLECKENAMKIDEQTDKILPDQDKSDGIVFQLTNELFDHLNQKNEPGLNVSQTEIQTSAHEEHNSECSTSPSKTTIETLQIVSTSQEKTSANALLSVIPLDGNVVQLQSNLDDVTGASSIPSNANVGKVESKVDGMTDDSSFPSDSNLREVASSFYDVTDVSSIPSNANGTKAENNVEDVTEFSNIPSDANVGEVESISNDVKCEKLDISARKNSKDDEPGHGRLHTAAQTQPMCERCSTNSTITKPAVDLKQDDRDRIKVKPECFPRSDLILVSSAISDRYDTALLAEANKAILMSTVLAKEGRFDPQRRALPLINWNEDEMNLLRRREILQKDTRGSMRSPDFFALKKSINHFITDNLLNEIKSEILHWAQNDFEPKWKSASEVKGIPQFHESEAQEEPMVEPCRRKRSLGRFSPASSESHLSTDRLPSDLAREFNTSRGESRVCITLSVPLVKRSSLPLVVKRMDSIPTANTKYRAKYRYMTTSNLGHNSRDGDLHRIQRIVTRLQALQKAEYVDPFTPPEANSRRAHLKIHLRNARNLPIRHLNAKNVDPFVTFKIVDAIDISNQHPSVKHRSSTKKRSTYPVWNETFAIAVADHLRSFLHVRILHDQKSTQKKIIGEIWISLFALLHQKQTTEWFPIEIPATSDFDSKATPETESAICLSLQLFHSKVDRLQRALDDAVERFLKGGNKLPGFIQPTNLAKQTTSYNAEELTTGKVDEIRIAGNDVDSNLFNEEPHKADFETDNKFFRPASSTRKEATREDSIATPRVPSSEVPKSIDIIENPLASSFSILGKAERPPKDVDAFEHSLENCEPSADSDDSQLSTEYTAPTNLYLDDTCEKKPRSTRRSQCDVMKPKLPERFQSLRNTQVAKGGKSTQYFDEYSLYHPSHLMAALYVLDASNDAPKNLTGNLAMRNLRPRTNAGNTTQNIRQSQKRAGNLGIFKRPNVPRRRPSTIGLSERYIGLDNQTSERLKRMFGRMSN
uniref:Uncharacterized protein AlNc14C2G343 n=1 Tax=Albugo laibachii Nc14 TaxID=890382 RepID=F0VZK5_9STRA|nr:conserved hypothetical protein [Albugo laibachii Nc14]|eukprot:CCA14235.1 conserved hypothetical protein [Albugo laibachii Nc14]